MTPFSWFNGGRQRLFNRPTAPQPFAQCRVFDAEFFSPIEKTLGFSLVGQQRKDFRSRRVMRRRNTQGLFNRPSGFQSPLDCGGFEAEDFGPIFHTHCLAIKGQHDVRSLISQLLVHRSPFAVPRFIPVIILDPFQRVLRRMSLTHILEKCFKRIAPAVTNRNTPGSIIAIRARSRVVTAAYHVPPCHVFRRASEAMLEASLSCLVAAETSAAFGVAGHKGGTDNGYVVSAVTSALPHSTVLSVSRKRQHGQASELLPRQIFRSLVKYGRLCVIHALAPLQPSVLRDGALFLQRICVY